MASSFSSASKLSDLELIRHENIKRNEAFLSEIGLSTISSNAPRQSVGEGVVKKKRRSVSIDVQQVPVRRSSRVAAIDVEHTQLSYSDDEEAGNVPRVRAGAKRKKSLPEAPLKAKQVPPTDPHSARVIAADYARFIGTGPGGGRGGADESNSNLGRVCKDLAFGKAAVMAASNGGTCPKFSKYSGVVEWKNCVYLWVNIGSSKPGEHVNVFSEGGKFMTWFGGSRMHADSHVVQRMLPPTTGSKAAANDTVLLLVRLEGEPYRCLGPVRAAEHNVTAHPIFIKWELMMFSELQNVKPFQALLQCA
jgi:hypothetical protein